MKSADTSLGIRCDAFGRISTPPPISPSPRDAGAGRGAILRRSGPPLPSPLLPLREERERARRVLDRRQDVKGVPASMGILRHSPSDALLVGLAALHGALLVVVP